MIEHRLAVGEELGEDRQQAQVEAHLNFTTIHCQTSGMHTGSAGLTTIHCQTSGMHTGSAGQGVGAQQPAAVGNAEWA
eukprot:472477-Prymnesium_polylepis.2